MKILAFSDLHLARGRAEALVAASVEADLVIGAGDFCNGRQGLDNAVEMLAGITAPMIVVPGNAESDDELRDSVRGRTTVLHGAQADVGDLKVFGIGGGIPPTPFGDWSWDLSEDAARGILDRCEEADILISHSPPKGAVDMTSQGVSVGSVAVREAILRVQPKLVLCGHIHDCWGQEAMIGESRVVNLGPTPNWFEM